ncbi:MAG: hypothetical protein FJ290_22780, partial [Planctomycetes bacterium]|nr:hypothetical protein [Planctomycetota bacterium]
MRRLPGIVLVPRPRPSSSTLPRVSITRTRRRTRTISSLAFIAAAFAQLAAGSEGIEVGEEFILLADGPGKGIQATPDAAFGDGTYLAVWREGWHGKGGAARVHAVRISAEGKVLDAKGIEVAGGKRLQESFLRSTQGAVPGKDSWSLFPPQEHPRVAFGGGVFL